MKKIFGLAFVCLALAMASIPLIAQDAEKASKRQRLEVSELVVRDPETGNCVTITANSTTAGIWVENKHLKRGVAMVSTGHTRDASQTFVSVYSHRQMTEGRGFNWAVSLGSEDEPVQQVSTFKGGTSIREIKLK